MHHAKRRADDSCRKTPACNGQMETVRHIFWDCACTAAMWAKIVGHWTGDRVARQATQHFMDACASRQVYSVPAHWRDILADWFQDDVDDANCVKITIWYILAKLSDTPADRPECSSLLGNSSSSSRQHIQCLGILPSSTPSYCEAGPL